MKYREHFSVPDKEPGKTRALLLLSGGLDSMLAGKVLEEQGIEIVAVSFESNFFGAGGAIKAAERLRWPLIIVDITEEQLRIVEKPKYGYGKNMNPCIDCHAQMIRFAAKLLEPYEADFVATGEVLGERPKSQNRKALDIVAEESGIPELVLRPLSARLLKPTLPEKEGLVNRDALLDISGRSRRRQFELANKYGLDEFPTPGGGCLLTEPTFSGRLRKLMKWRGRLTPDDVELVKYGRSFFEQSAWIVIARNESETKQMEKLARPDDVVMTTVEEPGPVTIVRPLEQELTEEIIRKAAALTIRYSKLRNAAKASVQIKGGSKLSLSFEEWKPYLEQPYIPQF